MAIKIQTRETYIPIEIGELEFRFNISDDSILNLQNIYADVQKQLSCIQDELESEEDEGIVMQKVKTVLKEGTDLLLGEGAFEKLYELSPSVQIVTRYLSEIAEGLAQELTERGYNTALDKYKDRMQK